MSYKEAIGLVRQGHKCRRPCWQPGWIELGVHQNKLTVFYKSDGGVIDEISTMPEVYCTYTPFRKTLTNNSYYPEDELALDWVLVDNKSDK